MKKRAYSWGLFLKSSTFFFFKSKQMFKIFEVSGVPGSRFQMTACTKFKINNTKKTKGWSHMGDGGFPKPLQGGKRCPVVIYIYMYIKDDLDLMFPFEWFNHYTCDELTSENWHGELFYRTLLLLGFYPSTEDSLNDGMTA